MEGHVARWQPLAKAAAHPPAARHAASGPQGEHNYPTATLVLGNMYNYHNCWLKLFYSLHGIDVTKYINTERQQQTLSLLN